jgi:hypothetical protein
MDPLQPFQASQPQPTPKKNSPEVREIKEPKEPKEPQVEGVPDLLAQWPSPDKVIFETLQIKGRLSLQPILPPSISIDPYELFTLFIPEDLYAIILKHINLYARLQDARERGRTWKPKIPRDIKTFFACNFLYRDLGGTAY